MELVRFLHKLLRRITEEFPVPLDLDLDTWALRSQSEALHGPSLANVVFNGLIGPTVVCYEALMFDRHILPIDLSSLRGSQDRFYPNLRKWERLAHFRTGFLILYQSADLSLRFPNGGSRSNVSLVLQYLWHGFSHTVE